jgi:hypothetical protein
MCELMDKYMSGTDDRNSMPTKDIEPAINPIVTLNNYTLISSR